MSLCKDVYNLIDNYCVNCERDKKFQIENKKGCELICKALFISLPEEFVYIQDGTLKCTVYDTVNQEELK